MMFRTHLAFAFLIGLIFLNFFSLEFNKYLFLFIVLIASVIPDIDLSGSKIGRRIKPLSNIFNFLFGHRGFLHSLLFILILFLIFVFVKNEVFGLALFLGFFSHLALDSLSKEGIRFFYPLKFKINGFIKTNRIMENMLFFGFLVLSLFFVNALF